MKRIPVYLLVFVGLTLTGWRLADTKPFQALLASFANEFREYRRPVTYDYREYFAQIPSVSQLERQEQFFHKTRRQLTAINRQSLDSAEQLYYEHLSYEVDLNLERLALEKNWVQAGRTTPVNGLFTLPNAKEWYAYRVRQYTSAPITPEEVYALGQSEVKYVRNEMAKIQRQLGFSDITAFYQHLQADTFLLTDKKAILAGYSLIDSTVRAQLHLLFIDARDVPTVSAMEWPGAGPNTPPGIYLSHSSNSYGRDIFQYNFYGNRHNKRAMEWLYMHEAIPGHHLQSTLRRQQQTAPTFQEQFIYPGNFEGWACYVEDLGEQVGLYRNPYAKLGKWEWDLVRSARLVLDVGIHYYGWSYQQAMTYWKANIPGQDAIAEREINRVTNWPCQAMAYKVGADRIRKLVARQQSNNPRFDLKAFHQAYLKLSYFPMAIVEEQLGAGT